MLTSTSGRRLQIVLAAALASSAAATRASAQTVESLLNQPPDGAGIGFLMTDGTAVVQGNNLTDWWKLTPDAAGSYRNGTWSQIASLPAGYNPYAFASDVLADGRLVIMGGEYLGNKFTLTDLCAVYDPVGNTWKEFPAPAGWGYIGDSPSSVLADGRLLLGRKLDRRIAALDPATLTWTELAHSGKRDFNAEEGWTMLPNGEVLTYDVKAAPFSELYNSAVQRWQSAGSTMVRLGGPPEAGPISYGPGLVYTPPGETGPAILLPNGTVFATGATPKGGTHGFSAVFTPLGLGGTWKAGPSFPAGDDAADTFAALLPSGHVLVEGAQTGIFYEYDGVSLARTTINGRGNALLVLPTGEVLVGGSFLYKGAGKPDPAWAPAITSAPKNVVRGTTYEIKGTQLNGLSQANSFGDEFQTATNYPLVRITSAATGQVVYARTHDHSTMAVATGNAVVSTSFELPPGAPTGAASLEVVANGIASKPARIDIQ